MPNVNISILNHNAKNGYGAALKGYFISDSSDSNLINLHEEATDKKVGYIDFQILREKKLVFINDMENLTSKRPFPYKGIGNLLHEFIIFVMTDSKLSHYSIQLMAAYNSYAFHYRVGFRFHDQEKNERMAALIKLGKAAYTNPKNLKDFPDSMFMPMKTIELKKQYYLTARFEEPNKIISRNLPI